jgi:hypothetical protein
MGILSEPEAFEDMFSEKLCRIKTGTGGYVGVPQRLLGEGWTGEYLQRADLDIPPYFTTDPQAEVLCLENIKPDYRLLRASSGRCPLQLARSGSRRPIAPVPPVGGTFRG